MASNYKPKRTNKAYGKLTDKKLKKFFELVEQGISIAGAARSIGVSHSTVYNALKRHSNLAERLAVCREAGADRMEDALLNIGIADRNVTALIFLLKGKRPEIYREKYQADLINSDGSLSGLFAEVMKLNGHAEQSCSNETNKT